jgi:hypothetical protein
MVPTVSRFGKHGKVHYFSVCKWQSWFSDLCHTFDVCQCNTIFVISVYHTMHFYFWFPLFPGVENMEKCTIRIHRPGKCEVEQKIVRLSCIQAEMWGFPCFYLENQKWELAVRYIQMMLVHWIPRPGECRVEKNVVHHVYKPRYVVFHVENIGILHCTCSNSYAILVRESYNSFPLQ